MEIVSEAPVGTGRPGVSEGDRMLIPLETCELTLSQLMERIRELQSQLPDCEIFMDGDAYAIIARPRAVRRPPRIQKSGEKKEDGCAPPNGGAGKESLPLLGGLFLWLDLEDAVHRPAALDRPDGDRDVSGLDRVAPQG